MLNPPVARLLPVETGAQYISILCVGMITLLLYERKFLVVTSKRCFLCIISLLMLIQFAFPIVGHSFVIKIFLAYIPLFGIFFWGDEIYFTTFEYFRKLMIFFAICSILLIIVFILFPYNALPYVELTPLSAAHLNKGIVYRLYGFLVTYDTIIFNIQNVSLLRATGPFTEPGHFGVFLGLTVCIEKILWNKCTPVLIICGCLTLSTAFYVILGIMGIYSFFTSKKSSWKVLGIALFSILLAMSILLLLSETLREILWYLTIGRNFEDGDILDNRANNAGLLEYSRFLRSSFSTLWWGHGTFAMEVRGIVLSDYREFFYDSGILGLLLVFTMLLIIFSKSYLKHLCLFIPILFVIFMHRAWMFWYPYIYIFLIIGLKAYTYKTKLKV